MRASLLVAAAINGAAGSFAARAAEDAPPPPQVAAAAEAPATLPAALSTYVKARNDRTTASSDAAVDPRPIPNFEAAFANAVWPAGTFFQQLRRADAYPQTAVLQGMSNACGTASLASGLNFWAGVRTTTREDVDAIRPRHLDLGTLPGALVDAYRARGFRAEAYVPASPEVMRGYVQAGVPVHIIVSAERVYRAMGWFDDDIPATQDVHYVTVFRVNEEAGQPVDVEFADSNLYTPLRLPWEQFINEIWRSNGFSYVFNRTMVMALPKQPTAVVGQDGTIRDASKLPLPWVTGTGPTGPLRLPYEILRAFDK